MARTSGEGNSSGRTVLVVVIAILAVAAAIFSITRTVRSSQGENKGSLPGFAGKAQLMQQQQGEEAPAANVGVKGGSAEGPAGAGMEGPAQQPGLMMGGKGAGGK